MVSAQLSIRSLAQAGVAFAALMAAPVLAQAQPAVVASPVGDLQEAQAANPDDIIVVARRRAENILTVPLSVTAFSESQLMKAGAYDLGGIQGAVPNLNIVQGRGSATSANITIRGIGQPDALQTFDPAVGVYVDGVYMSRIQGAMFSMMDVAQVEVLRGPQGTLYGKNTIGGAINIISRKPGNDLKVMGSLAYGSYNQILGNVYASVPLVQDKLAVGIAGTYDKRDGTVTDLNTGEKYNDRNIGTGRIIVRATPNERLEIMLSGDYTHQDSSLTLGSNQAPICQNALFLPAGQVNKACQPPQGFFGNKVIANAAGPWNRTSATDFKNGEGQEMTSWGVSGTVNAELNDMFTLVSITAYRELKPQYYIDIDATTTQTGNVKVFVDQNQFSQELQLKLASDKFDGVFGLYYLNENLQSDQVAYANDVFSLFGTVPVTFQRTVHDSQDLKSYAAYGQVTWKATDTFSVTGGLRYTDENKTYFRTTTTTSSLAALNGTFTFPDSLYTSPAMAGFDLNGIDNQGWSAWTPMITASYTVAPGQMIYATASKGFKSGGFNGRANSATDLIQVVDGVRTLAVTFQPESAWNFEGGYKANYADGKVTLAVSGFYTNYKNFQARVGETDVNGFGFLPVINAGAMRIYGFEMESTVRLIPNLVLTGSLGYLNAAYTEFDDTRANGCNPTGTKIVCEPAFAPPITARLAADYTLPVGVDDSVGFGGDVRLVGQQFLSVDNRRPALWEPGYTILNAYVRYDAPKWYVMGQVRNATNAVYKTDAQEFSSVSNIQTAYWGDPRTFLGTVGFRF